MEKNSWSKTEYNKDHCTSNRESIYQIGIKGKNIIVWICLHAVDWKKTFFVVFI